MVAEVPPATLPGTPKVISLCQMQSSVETLSQDARIVLPHSLKACTFSTGLFMAAELSYRGGKAD